MKNTSSPYCQINFKSEATFVFISQCGSKESWKTSKLFEVWTLVKKKRKEKNQINILLLFSCGKPFTFLKIVNIGYTNFKNIKVY